MQQMQIVKMSKSSRAHVRFAAVCCLGKRTPEKTTDAVLEASLLDKSAYVRSKAGEEANALQRENLIPNIEASLAAETNDGAKKSLELSLRMLRDGFWLQDKQQHDQKTISVSTPDGGIIIAMVQAIGVAARTASNAAAGPPA